MLSPSSSSKGPILILVIMGVLFVALIGTLIGYYNNSWKYRDRPLSRPAASTTSRPTSRPLPAEAAVPSEAGFSARNLEFGGNLSALVSSDGEPLGMNDAFHRMAEQIKNIPGDWIAAKATQMPPMRDLLEHASAYRGCVFAVRVVPAEINDHDIQLPVGRIRTWRTYGMLQRNTDEFAVFDSLETPPMKGWTLKRDVVEIDAVFVRTAVYKAGGGKLVTVPYFIPKNYQLITEDIAAGPAPGIGALLHSEYGPMVLIGVVLFVGLTLWTLRRHGRMVEKQERAQFYGLLRAKKKPTAASNK